MKNNQNKSILKLIKRKVDFVKNLEQQYWTTINNQRIKFSSLDNNSSSKFEEHFPKDQSSLIYGCLDGVVLIRHSENPRANIVEVKILNILIEKLLLQLPIPYRDGRMINFSAIAKLNFGSLLKIGKLKLNGEFEINNLQISVLKYEEVNNNLDLEDALLDVKLAILGMNINIQHENESTPKKEAKTILEIYNSLKVQFEELLKSSNKEEELQLFIKEYPIIVQPYSTIYPKKKLGDDFVTDFVYSNTLEQGIKYTFVEIEKASMPIFTKNGELTAEFNHAQKQTLDWEIWLEQNINYLKNKLTGLEKPNFLIIAGRSTNFTEANRAILRAWNRRQNNTEFLTFDDVSFKFGELIKNMEEMLNKSSA